jgi:hypothetical protein
VKESKSLFLTRAGRLLPSLPPYPPSAHGDTPYPLLVLLLGWHPTHCVNTLRILARYYPLGGRPHSLYPPPPPSPTPQPHSYIHTHRAELESAGYNLSA